MTRFGKHEQNCIEACSKKLIFSLLTMESSPFEVQVPRISSDKVFGASLKVATADCLQVDG